MYQYGKKIYLFYNVAQTTQLSANLRSEFTNAILYNNILSIIQYICAHTIILCINCLVT